MAAEFLTKLADFLWGNWLLFVLLGVGVIYTVFTGCIQIRKFPFIVKTVLADKRNKSSDKGITSFQALCAAVASCVGSGNIVGVSTAVIAGGPGALFWMWVAAFLGMATKFAEIVLGMCYRGKLKTRKGIALYKILFPIAILVGSLATPDIVWTLQDCALGLLIIPNIITLVIMVPTVGRLTREFFDNYQ